MDPSFDASSSALMTRLQDFFWIAQLLLVGGVVWLIRARSAAERSGFKTTEAERLAKDHAQKAAKQSKSGDALAQARASVKRPLQIEGLSLSGAPHEILGVKPNASRDEIQQAYRTLMKRYHPDQVGRPGSREWEDAQAIARALTDARDALLKSKPES